MMPHIILTEINLPEVQLMVDDLRAIQRMDSHSNKRFCTVQYFGKRADGVIGDMGLGSMTAVETVMDVQGSC